MAKKFRTRSQNDPNSKIVSVNQQIGQKNIGAQQATSRVIYDSTLLSTNANTQTYTLFLDCRTRKFPLTNLTENKLQKGESIALQRFSMYIIECTAGTTNAIAVVPLGYLAGTQGLYASTFNFQIGQTVTMKNFPLAKMYAPFNPDSQFVTMYQFQTVAAGVPTSAFTSLVMSHDVFNFDADVIIPPDVEFRCDVTIPAFTVPGGFDLYLAMSLSGLGSLYAPKGNF